MIFNTNSKLQCTFDREEIMSIFHPFFLVNFFLESIVSMEYYLDHTMYVKTVCHEGKSCSPLVGALPFDKEDPACHQSLVALVTVWPFGLPQTVFKI